MLSPTHSRPQSNKASSFSICSCFLSVSRHSFTMKLALVGGGLALEFATLTEWIISSALSINRPIKCWLYLQCIDTLEGYNILEAFFFNAAGLWSMELDPVAMVLCLTSHCKGMSLFSLSLPKCTASSDSSLCGMHKWLLEENGIAKKKG